MAGKLVHFELPARDAERSQQFYSSLFGWSFQGYEGAPSPYLMTQIDEGSGGAIYQTEGDERSPTIYFDCDDIEATLARVRELGGSTDDKMPVPGMGWFAKCTDTEGTTFSVWQSDESASMPQG
jgi:uncharacterized protein